MEQKGRRHKKNLLEENQKLARDRAMVILQVRSGLLTAKEGAKLLGVSRKTYYEWEDRALQAMALALENHLPGRPPVPLDAEKEELQRKVRDLEKRLYLAEKTIEVKELLSAYDTFRDKGTKKNGRPARGDKKSCGDCGGDEETNEDALRDDLQDASSPFGEP